MTPIVSHFVEIPNKKREGETANAQTTIIKTNHPKGLFFHKTKKKKVIDYFKCKDKEVKEKEKNEVFDIILVDIKSTSQKDEISCVKKNMYDEDLKYIAISYRWGELDEQLIETPDYTAHIISFDINDLLLLCKCFINDTDLNRIPYLWIDAISVDQQNHSRKKETILQMSKIYKRASYILAVPDLHFRYLLANPENNALLDLIFQYSEVIGYKITKMFDQTDDNYDDDDDNDDDGIKDDYGRLVSLQRYNDIRKIYRFLAYLVQDWANRAWVISEYQIAKEKKEKYGTPMKYTFICLAYYNTGYYGFKDIFFFSYSFDHQNININDNDHNNKKIPYMEVDTGRMFIKFLKNVLTHQSYIDMLLNSKASRNEDRFNAILPSWKECSDVIKDKNNISSWQITDMVSVRLKLYEIMDDLWDKARLLYACSHHSSPGFPTFARCHRSSLIIVKEIDGYGPFSYIDPDGEYYSIKKQKGFTTGISPNNVSDNEIDHSTKYALNFYYVPYEIKSEQMQVDRASKIKQFTNNVVPDNIRDTQMGDANLIDIQLNNHGKYGHPYLTVKSKLCYYCILDKEESDYLKSEYSLKDVDDLIGVRIPFFIPGKTGFDGSDKDISDVYLFGDKNKNIWIVYYLLYHVYPKDWTFVFTDGYAFNVY